MPSACGVSLNLSNLKSGVISNINTVVNLSGFVGTPPGLVAIQGAIGGIVLSVKASVLGMLPNVPFSSEFLSLRDQIGALTQLPNKLAALAGDELNTLLGDFGGLSGLDIGANINLNDLAASAINIGASFDPCGLAGGIPNIIKDGAGALQSLPSIQPNLGLTTPAAFSTKIKQTYFDDALSGIKDNVADVTSLISTATSAAGDVSSSLSSISSFDIGTITDALESNVGPTLSGLGSSLKTLPSGATIFQSQEDFLLEQVSFSQFFEEG
jgi:hypothetical protein